MARGLEEKTTLFMDIESIGASNLRGFKYKDSNSDQTYTILKGFPGRIKPHNSSFRVQYSNGRIESIKVKENHYDDIRVIN